MSNRCCCSLLMKLPSRSSKSDPFYDTFKSLSLYWYRVIHSFLAGSRTRRRQSDRHQDVDTMQLRFPAAKWRPCASPIRHYDVISGSHKSRPPPLSHDDVECRLALSGLGGNRRLKRSPSTCVENTYSDPSDGTTEHLQPCTKLHSLQLSIECVYVAYRKLEPDFLYNYLSMK